MTESMILCDAGVEQHEISINLWRLAIFGNAWFPKWEAWTLREAFA